MGWGLSVHDLLPPGTRAGAARELPAKGLYPATQAAGPEEEETYKPAAEAYVWSVFQARAREREEGWGWVAAGGACEII